MMTATQLQFSTAMTTAEPSSTTLTTMELRSCSEVLQKRKSFSISNADAARQPRSNRFVVAAVDNSLNKRTLCLAQCWILEINEGRTNLKDFGRNIPIVMWDEIKNFEPFYSGIGSFNMNASSCNVPGQYALLSRELIFKQERWDIDTCR